MRECASTHAYTFICLHISYICMRVYMCCVCWGKFNSNVWKKVG